MKLIATRQARTDKTDRLRCVRRDGSATAGRGCGVPVLAAGSGQALFDAVLALDARWRQVPWYGTLELEMLD